MEQARVKPNPNPIPQDRSHMDLWPDCAPRVLHVKTNLPQSWKQMNALRRSLTESTVRIKTVVRFLQFPVEKKNKSKF